MISLRIWGWDWVGRIHWKKIARAPHPPLMVVFVELFKSRRTLPSKTRRLPVIHSLIEAIIEAVCRIKSRKSSANHWQPSGLFSASSFALCGAVLQHFVNIRDKKSFFVLMLAFSSTEKFFFVQFVKRIFMSKVIRHPHSNERSENKRSFKYFAGCKRLRLRCFSALNYTKNFFCARMQLGFHLAGVGSEKNSISEAINSLWHH